MMKYLLTYRCLVCCLLLYGSFWNQLTAQSAVLQQTVTVQYYQVRLGDALKDISQNYQVYFSYSKDLLPVDQKVNAQAENAALEEVLVQLLAETQVIYSSIGDQIVLKVDGTKSTGQIDKKQGERLYGSLNLPPQAKPIVPYKAPTEDLITLADEQKKLDDFKKNLQRQWEVERLESEYIEFAQASIDPMHIPMEIELGSSALDRRRPWEQRLAQVSVLPFIGTNMVKSAVTENNVSVNIFGGRNGGVNGFELGGFFNSVKYDVRGVQIAGLGNLVGGELEGTQLAGLFNHNKGNSYGMQFAGLLNIVKSDANGLQFAGLSNIAGSDMRGTQLAGLVNITKGNARNQLAGLVNIAESVEKQQAAAILNIAGRVNGNQLGLVNVSDTISGVPLGLINIVRHGYNRIELAMSDAMKYNLSLKLGAYRFYNIFLINYRKGDTHGTGGSKHSWGLGYGFGTSRPLGVRALMNMELVSMHINEGEAWTTTLNQLSELRVTFDWQFCKNSSIFAGPVFRVMVSNLQDQENLDYGSAIPKRSLINWETESRSPTDTNIWLGWTAGFRF